jgi:hypothetical protein
MFDSRLQDLLTIAAGEARAEAYLDVVKTMLREYYPDVKMMRQILGVAEPATPDFLKKEADTDAE